MGKGIGKDRGRRSNREGTLRRQTYDDESTHTSDILYKPLSSTNDHQTGLDTYKVHVAGVGTTGQHMENDGRIKIQIIGNAILHPSSVCARHIRKIFEEKIDIGGSTWKNVSPETKEFYWMEFQKYFIWDQTITQLVRLAWQKKAGERYKGMLVKMRQKKDKRPWFVPKEAWVKFNEDWNCDDFVRISQQNRQNRQSTVAGGGTLRHTCGSITITEHAKRLETEWGRAPTMNEVYEYLHMKDNDREKWVDEKSRRVHEEFINLRDQLSQTDNEPRPADEQALVFKAIEGQKMSKVYGFDSQASVYFEDCGGSTSVSMPTHDPTVDEQLEIMRQKMKEHERFFQERLEREKAILTATLEEQFQKQIEEYRQQMEQLQTNMINQMQANMINQMRAEMRQHFQTLIGPSKGMPFSETKPSSRSQKSPNRA